MRDTAPTTTLHIVYLARLREAFGTTQERLALAGGAAPTTVADIVALLRQRGGAYATELGAGRAVRAAVNHTMVTPDAVVRPGDELALFPPVTGG